MELVHILLEGLNVTYLDNDEYCIVGILFLNPHNLYHRVVEMGYYTFVFFVVVQHHMIWYKR